MISSIVSARRTFVNKEIASKLTNLQYCDYTLIKKIVLMQICGCYTRTYDFGGLDIKLLQINEL